MYDQWPDFFRASGALSVICYREDIEAAIRTPGFGGFQLLVPFPVSELCVTRIFCKTF
jgi:hypothetical protein